MENPLVVVVGKLPGCGVEDKDEAEGGGEVEGEVKGGGVDGVGVGDGVELAVAKGKKGNFPL